MSIYRRNSRGWIEHCKSACPSVQILLLGIPLPSQRGNLLATSSVSKYTLSTQNTLQLLSTATEKQIRTSSVCHRARSKRFAPRIVAENAELPRVWKANGSVKKHLCFSTWSTAFIPNHVITLFQSRSERTPKNVWFAYLHFLALVHAGRRMAGEKVPKGAAMRGSRCMDFRSGPWQTRSESPSPPNRLPSPVTRLR